VLRTWLGRRWLQQRFHNHPFLNPQPLGFGTDAYKRQIRIVRLAELLLNLQHIDGIELLVPRLRKGSLVGDVAELEGAARLLCAGIPFKFVKRTGVLGKDYDVEADFGRPVCCEMKGKIASPSVATFVQTLRDADKQVPIDTPNVLFFQPPESWMLSEQGYRSIYDGLAEYFRRSDRYAYVVVHAEEVRPLIQVHDGAIVGASVAARTFKPYPNPNARVALPGAGEEWLNIDSANWLGIARVVCGPHHDFLMPRGRERIHAFPSFGTRQST
jgi:hypothetical protein